MAEALKVFIVDDSELLVKITTAALQAAGYQVASRTSPFGAAAAIIREKPNILLIDVKMPGLGGEDLVRSLCTKKVVGPETVIVLYSELEEEHLVAAVQRCGADGYVRKVKEPALLMQALRPWADLADERRR